MEKQALAGEGAVVGFFEKRETVTSLRLAEGRKRLEKMESFFVQEWPLKFLSSLDSMKEIFKGLEEEQASWRRERESMDGELCRLRSEVEQLRAAVAASTPPQICDADRGSEEIDLKELAEHKWLEGRQVLAPITPEAVRTRTLVTKQGVVGGSGVSLSGKENIRSNGEEIQRLRRENELLREKATKLSKEHKGLKTQYSYLLSKVDRLGSKEDAGQVISNQDKIQAALEASAEKPSKIRRRSPVEAQTEGGNSGSPSHSSYTSAPSTTGILPPQTVAEIVTGPTASTSGSRDRHVKFKAEPVHLGSIKEIPQTPSTKDNTSAGLECEPDRTTDTFVPTAMAGSRKRPLESLGKELAKAPAFKFVEPVRKKAERENLQATECKLCKKFYDAVTRGDANGAAQSRCIHVDKSRHRFRDLPPATPDGFWNIGFDSDF